MCISETMSIVDSIPNEVILVFFFSIDLILPAALDPGVHSASNTNEFQESSLGLSAARA
jgi:hypothetical protein